MADLFDLVRAAPPPDKIRPSPILKRSRTISPIPSPASLIWSDNSVNDKADNSTTAAASAATTSDVNAVATEAVANEKAIATQSSKRAVVRIKRFSLQETTDYYANNDDDDVKDEDDKDITKLKTLKQVKAEINASNCFTKTKAQQKQFDDDLPMSSNSSEINATIGNDDDADADANYEEKPKSAKKVDKSATKTKTDKSKSSTKKEETKPNTKKLNKSKIERTLNTMKKSAALKNLKVRALCVRLERLKASYIADCIAGKKQNKSARPNKSSLNSSSVGQKRKQSAASPTAAFPAKKQQKSFNGSSPNIAMHFKFTPSTNRFKGRRLPTPPPSSTPKSIPLSPAQKRLKLNNNNSKIAKKYGSRVLRSYVRMERCKHPLVLTFEANERARKSRRPNLSVSFRDAVEIIGVGAGDGSVPTRLTKVQNGKVVDCVALDQTPFTMPVAQSALSTSSSSLSLSTSALSSTPLGGKDRHNGRKRSLNDSKGIDGGTARHGSAPKMARRRLTSTNNLPLNDMARLCISNAEDEDDDNEEYIVPNDVPECRPSTSLTPAKDTSTTAATKTKKPSPAAAAASLKKTNTKRRVLKSPPPPSSGTSSKTTTSSPLSKKSNEKAQPKRRSRKSITTTLSAQSSKESSPVAAAEATAGATETLAAETPSGATRTVATEKEVEPKLNTSSDSAKSQLKENENSATAAAINDDADDDVVPSKKIEKSPTPSTKVDADQKLSENNSSSVSVIEETTQATELTKLTKTAVDAFVAKDVPRRSSGDSTASFSTAKGTDDVLLNGDNDETKQNGNDNNIDDDDKHIEAGNDDDNDGGENKEKNIGEDTKKINDTLDLEVKNKCETDKVATTKSSTADDDDDVKAGVEQHHDSNSVVNKSALNDKNATKKSTSTSSASNADNLTELDETLNLTDDVLTIGLNEQDAFFY